MNFRKLILGGVAAAALFGASALQAQDQKKGGRGGMSVEQQIERIETAVGKLTDEQKTKISAIYAKVQEKLQSIPQEERREKMGQVFQETRKEVRAVLTPEQQKKYDEMPQRGGGGSGAGNGSGRKKNN